MEFIFLIILCFFLGMLIYSLMKKFCGCNLVEGNDHICSGSYSASMCSELSASFCDGYYYSASGSASGVYCETYYPVIMGSTGNPLCRNSASYCSTTPTFSTGPSASMCNGSLISGSGVISGYGVYLPINASGCGYEVAGMGGSIYAQNCSESFVHDMYTNTYKQCSWHPYGGCHVADEQPQCTLPPNYYG